MIICYRVRGKVDTHKETPKGLVRTGFKYIYQADGGYMAVTMNRDQAKPFHDKGAAKIYAMLWPKAFMAKVVRVTRGDKG